MNQLTLSPPSQAPAGSSWYAVFLDSPGPTSRDKYETTPGKYGGQEVFEKKARIAAERSVVVDIRTLKASERSCTAWSVSVLHVPLSGQRGTIRIR